MKTRLWDTCKPVLAVVLAASFIGLGACKSTTAPPISRATSAIRPTPISAALEPDVSASRVSQFQAKGNLNLAGATFLALTRLEAVSTHEDVYQFTATSPANIRAEVTLTVMPGQRYTPTAEERAVSGVQAYQVSLDHSVNGDSCQMKLSYFLPQRALGMALKRSPGAISPPNLAMAAASASLSQAGTYGGTKVVSAAAPLAQSGGEGGIGVELVAAVTEGGMQLLGTVEATTLNVLRATTWQSIFGFEDESPVGTAVGSAQSVIEALNMSAAYKEMVAELDELQAEAENPSNPLTQKAYAEDPGAKQVILDEIANARSEMKMDCLVDYLNTEISVALGLAGSPALSVAVAPITTWNGNTIKQVMRERIANIRKMITRGVFSTRTIPPKDQGTSSPPSSGTSGTSPATKLPPNTWTASYESQNKTASSDGRTTLVFTDKGTIQFTLQKDGSIEGTGQGHLVFHGEEPHRVSDGQTGYSFTVGGVKVGGKIQFTLAGAPNPLTFPVTSVSSDGRRETGPVPVTAPLLLPGPVDLKPGGTASVDTSADQGQGGMRVTFTGTLTIN